MRKKYLILLNSVISLSLHASASTAATPTPPPCSDYENDCLRQTTSWQVGFDCRGSKRDNFLQSITANAKLTAPGKELITKNYDACCSNVPTYPFNGKKIADCYCIDGANLLRQAGLCI